MSSRPPREVVPRPWYVDAILIAAALLLMLGLFVMVNPHAALQRVFSRSIGDDEAKRSLAAWAGGESRLPASLRVLDTRVDLGRDSTRWYKFSVDPSHLPALKRSVLESGGQRFSDGADVDDLDLLPDQSSRPLWWDPHQLPDADLLQDGMTYFVFSQSTGAVYVVDWDF